jgi:hypothetical protein
MAASTSPFVLQGTLSYPPEQEQAQLPLPFGLSGVFTSLMSERLVMTGIGNLEVPFGSVVGAKVLLLEYELAEAAAVITLHINGSTDGLELSPGGVLLFASPNPTVGLTSLNIACTVDAVVRVHVLG